MGVRALFVALFCSMMLLEQTNASFSVVGCYEIDVTNRVFVTSAGDYSPDAIDHETCVDACSILDYQYAALTIGRYCLCSSSTYSGPETGTCDRPCSGNAGQMCGGTQSDFVLSVDMTRAAVQLNSTNDVFVVGQPQSLQPDVTGDAVTTSFDYGDGSPATADDGVLPKNHVYAVPGQYAASIIAQNSFSSDFAGTQVTAYMTIANVTMECPDVVEPSMLFTCTITVEDGSDMTLSSNIGSPYHIGTPNIFSVGTVSQYALSSLQSDTVGANTVWILPGYEFLDDGVIRSVEVNAQVSGMIQFLILEPYCTGAGETYCLIDNQCSPSPCDYDTSMPTNPLYHTSCDSASKVFCLSEHRCASRSDESTCDAEPARYTFSVGVSPRASYRVRHVITQAAVTGYNYFEINFASRTAAAQIGDVLGYAVTAGGAEVGYESTGSGEAVAFSAATPTVTDGTVFTAGLTAESKRFHIRLTAINTLSVILDHEYPEVGTETLSVNVNNTLNPVGISTTSLIEVQSPIRNLSISLTPNQPYFASNANISLTLSVDSGDPIDVEIDWGDGNITIHTGLSALPVFKHFYDISANGETTITVTAANLHGNETASETIYIQHPVLREHYSILPDTPASHPYPRPEQGYINITVQLLAPNGKPYGTDPNISFSSSYFDNSTHVMSLSNEGDYESYTHPVQFPGTYTVLVTIQNLVETITFEEKVELYGIISSDIRLDVLYQPLIPPDGDPIPNLGNNLPLERDIVFEPVYSSGTNITFEYLDFDDNNSVPINTTDDTLSYKYNDPGEYTVTVAASNPVSERYTISSTFQLFKTIHTIEVSTGDITIPNQPKNFTITIGQIGYNSCLAIDYGDYQTPIMYGEAVCDGHWKAPSANYIGPLSHTINLLHTYADNGSYVFTVHAFNLVTDTIIEEPFAVTYLECNVPEVSFNDGHPQWMDPKTVETFEYVPLRTETSLRCKINDNFKEWSVEQFNSSSGEIVPGLSMNLTGLASTDNFYVGPADTADIKLNAYTYPPGYYRISYCVTMDSSKLDGVVFTACAREYIHFLSFSLEARVVDGQLSSTTIGFGQIFNLNPGLYSKDPSLDPTETDQGIERFKYYCKRFYEEFRLNNDRTLDDTPVPITDAGGSEGGCFGMGPGRLDHNESSLDLNTGWMNSNMTYDIKVIIEKGPISGEVMFELKIVQGDPPQPVISLSEGTPFTAGSTSIKVNPSSDLRLKSNCVIDCDGVTYVWMIDYNNGTHVLPLAGWDSNNLATGVNTDAVFINRLVFQLQPTAVSYVIRLEATNIGGVVGITEIEAALNSPPSGGSCGVVGSHTINLGDPVYISCSGWTDEDGISSYVFYAVDEETRQLLVTSSRHEALVTLPVGEVNNTVEVSITISDRYGALVVASAGNIYVDPGEIAETILTDDSVNELIDAYDKLQSEGSLVAITEKTTIDISALNVDRTVTNIRIDGEIEEFEGNLGEQNETITTMSSTAIRELQAQKLTKTTIRAFTRSKIAKLQEEVTINNMEDAQVMAASAIDLSTFTDELSQSTLTSLSKVAENIINTTEEQKDTVSTETLSTTAELLLGLMGNILEGSALSVENSLPVLEEFENSEDQSFSALQASISEATSSLDDEDTTTEWTPEKEENLQRKRGQARVVVNDARNKLKTIKSLLGRNTLPREPPLSISTPTISLTYEKNTCDDLANREISEDFGSVVIGSLADTVDDPTSVCGNGNVITRETTSSKKNSWNYEESSDRISRNSGTMEVNFETLGGVPIDVSNARQKIIIDIKRPGTEEPIWNEYGLDEFAAGNITNVTYHNFDISYNNTAITIQLQVENTSCYAMLIGFSGFPNASSFDDIRLFYYDVDGNDTSDKVIYQIFYNSSVVGSNAGKFYAMLLELDCALLFNDYPDLSTADDMELLYAAGNTSRNFSTPYGFRVFSSGCSYWSELSEMWQEDGCEPVESGTDYSTQRCSCTHLTSFASTWIVPPTPLDFNYIFNNAGFLQNPTIYITTIVVYVFLFIFLLWARRRDRKDLLKLGVTPLPDNNPKHNYYYEVVVLTGQRKAAGTDSKVSFILSGENEETEVREFEDDKRKIFRRGASDRFLMAVQGPLGTLNYMRIWHDNSGTGKMQGWYVKYIAIRDIQTRERFYFIVNQWFSVVEDDGQIDRLIPVAGREQMQDFSHLFSNHTRKNFNDGHLWFSVIGRPPGSRFTRVQRAACCFMFLWLEMLVNIMWYKVSPPAAATNPIDIGPLSLSPAQISIGVQANIIVFPVSLLVVQFFRKSRPRKKRESRIKLAALVNKPMRKLKRRPRKTAPANYSKLEDFASPSRIVLEEPNKPMMMMNPTAGTRAEPSLVVPPVPGTYDETAVQGGRGAGYFNGDQSPTPGAGDATVLIQPEKPKRRKKFSLPWWCIIIAWVVLILSMAAATTVTVFYGIQFGDLEVREWLCSIVVSFVFGIFLTQPIKILLLAVFIACIVKSPNADEDTEMEEDEEDFDLGQDEEYLHTVSGHVSTKKRKLPYKPPDPEALERAREQRVKEIKMYSIFREIFFYVVYLWVVLVISYGNSDPFAYRMQEDFYNELVVGPDNIHAFTKINSHASFWAYLHNTLIPTIFPQTWYNGDPSPELEGFLAEQNAFILGFPVLRQVRVKRGDCEVVDEFENIVPECNVAYSFTASDDLDYGPGWTPYNANVTNRLQYNYTEWDEIESYPVLGRHALYAGGGYLAKLEGSQPEVESLLETLFQEAWLDKYTRGVFVEIASYNAQVNLFGVVSLLAEFLPTGGVETFYRIDIIRLYTYSSGFGAVRLACEILFLGFIVFFIVREVNNLRREGVKKYFKTFWNLAEWIIIACAIGATVVYFYRKWVTDNLLKDFKATGGQDRINLQYVAYWNELLTYLLGVVVFIGTLKFIKLLRFNKRIGILSTTIGSCTKDLIHFGIMFGIFFIAYALAFHQMYLRYLLDFSDFIFTMETLSAAMLGKFHYEGIAEANRILGPIFFFFFMITITFILVNMFLTIVIEAFSSVKRDITRQSNDYEMVDFMIGQLKKWVGYSGKSKPEDKKTTVTLTEKDKQDPMSEFPDKVDQLLDCIAKVYFDASQFEDVIRGMGGSKGESVPKKQPIKIITG